LYYDINITDEKTVDNDSENYADDIDKDDNDIGKNTDEEVNSDNSENDVDENIDEYYNDNNTEQYRKEHNVDKSSEEINNSEELNTYLSLFIAWIERKNELPS
ncbi:35756_t:CDS:2, partial [Gigaspora margarita]